MPAKEESMKAWLLAICITLFISIVAAAEAPLEIPDPEPSVWRFYDALRDSASFALLWEMKSRSTLSGTKEAWLERMQQTVGSITVIQHWGFRATQDALGILGEGRALVLIRTSDDRCGVGIITSFWDWEGGAGEKPSAWYWYRIEIEDTVSIECPEPVISGLGEIASRHFSFFFFNNDKLDTLPTRI